jgi:hypothetical protein
MDAPSADSQSNGFAVPQLRGGSGKLVASFRESETPTTAHAAFENRHRSWVLLRISNVWCVNAFNLRLRGRRSTIRLNNGNS